jgi:hypothetical protein
MSQLSREGIEEGPMDKRERSGCLAIRMAMWLAAILLCVVASGCKDVKTIWSTESRSPDGQWVATAHTDQYGGPGAAGILSTVSLRQVKGRQDNIEILQLSQDATGVDLKLNWLTPTHLEITYRQPASVDFQAIKCGGIDISVRDLSNGTTSPAQ